MPATYFVVLLVIKLDIAIFAQPTLPQELSFLLQNIFDCDTLIGEYLQMVGDEVAVLAARTGDEGCSEMIGLFGYSVGGAIKAFSAGKSLGCTRD